MFDTSFIVTYPNSADAANGGTVTAGSAASGFPATNLQTQALTQPWRSVSGDIIPGGGSTQAIGGGAGPILWPSSRSICYLPSYVNTLDYTVGLMALCAHNARPSVGDIANISKWRIRAIVSLNYPLDQMIRPGVITLSSVTNLAGVVAAVQDSPWLADGSWLTATSATSATSAIFTFSGAGTDGGSVSLKTGAAVQYFNLWLRKSAPGNGTNPTVTVTLLENGVSKATLCAGVAISSTTGTLLSVPWNAASLTALNTSNPIQVRVTSVAGTTSTVEIGAVEWLAEHTGYALDTGDMTVAYPPLVTRDTSNFHLVYPLPTPISLVQPFVGFARIVIDQVFTKDGYTSAGRLFVADTFQPFLNYDFGWSVAWVDPSIKTRSVGGQQSVDRRQKYRRGDFTCKGLRQAEADAIFGTIERLQGITGDLIWVPDPSTPSSYYNNVIVGTFSDLTPLSYPRFERYEKNFKVEESL